MLETRVLVPATCKWQEFKTDDTFSTQDTSKKLFICPWRSDKQLISHVTEIESPACSIKDFNDGKHVRFTTWDLSPPTDELIILEVRELWEKPSPWRSPTTSSLGHHLLPLHLTDAGVELSRSNPLKERKQKPKQRLNMYKKGKIIVGTNTVCRIASRLFKIIRHKTPEPLVWFKETVCHI